MPFEAQMRGAQVEEFQVLWIEGNGQLELIREQCGDGVLWLPFQGMIQEMINGDVHLGSPEKVNSDSASTKRRPA